MRRFSVIALAALACTSCGSSASLKLHVTPAISLLDAPISIRVTGADPGSTLEISARENGWTAHAVFRVAHDGTVDVATAASLGGSYTGKHPMGLLWSMRSAAAGATPSPTDGGALQVEVTRGERHLASTIVTRRAAAPNLRKTTLTVAKDGLFGKYFALPPDGTRHAAVLIFGGSEGGLSPEPDAKALASHGFPTLALAYFAEPGLPAELGRIPLEYFARAVRWLDRQPGVDPRRVVAYGESRGSEAALELGVHYPALVHGVVALVPSSEVNGGNVTYGIGVVPAWTFGGKPIPFTGARANIPVERIRGPILVAGGRLDLVWPSFYHAEDIAQRSYARHGPPVTLDEYPEAGHFGYALPYLPSSNAFSVGGIRHLIGGTTAANAAARADLWPRILRFLRGVPEANR